MTMKASEDCKKEVRWFEGFRSSIYLDANGHPTIGYGHKLTQEEIESGKYKNGITIFDARPLFEADFGPVEHQVNGLGWELTQGQYDSLCSFDYNEGINLLQMMLSHGKSNVPEEIVRWVYAGGKVQEGLVKRRAQELEWWNS